MIMEKKIFIECECHTHLLRVEKDPWENHGSFFLFSMFTYGLNLAKSNSFLERIKIAWKMLKTGETFNDEIILNEDECKKLIEFLSEK